MLSVPKILFRKGAVPGFIVGGLLLPLLAAGQAKPSHPWPLRENARSEKLYFVPDAADTTRCTGSVETASGKKILPNGFWMMGDCETVPERELTGNFTLIVPRNFKEPTTDTAMHYGYGFATFNQRGQFLHHPYIFDNGPDYWHEGRRRVVEGGKMGLVNRQGKAVIPIGTYRFLERAQKGILLACRDCSFYNPTREEHGGDFKGSDWDVLDVDGNVLAVHVAPDAKEVTHWQQMPRPFRNNLTTEKLAAQLLALPQVAAYAKLYSMPLESLRFQCYDVPSKESPYYLFGLESTADDFFLSDDMQVLISADGKEIYHLEDDLQRLVPEKEWKVVE